MSDKTPKNDDMAPWSVRGVPADIRGAVASHAKKAGIGIGEWLTIAVREKIKADRSGGKAIVVRGPVSMNEASTVVDMLARLSGAGVELPTSLQKSAVSMMTKVVREVSKGQTDSSQRHTSESSSMTPEHDSTTSS